MIIVRYTAPDQQLLQTAPNVVPGFPPPELDNKFSRVFDDPRYLYINAGKDGHGRSVHFCYSSHRNVAGFFLGWRETISPTKVKRDMWCARRMRSAVALIARRRAQTFQAVRQATEETP